MQIYWSRRAENSEKPFLRIFLCKVHRVPVVSLPFKKELILQVCMRGSYWECRECRSISNLLKDCWKSDESTVQLLSQVRFSTHW
jgi:hypothetical protein